jgi:hypothetical protein
MIRMIRNPSNPFNQYVHSKYINLCSLQAISVDRLIKESNPVFNIFFPFSLIYVSIYFIYLFITKNVIIYIIKKFIRFKKFIQNFLLFIFSNVILNFKIIIIHISMEQYH